LLKIWRVWSVFILSFRTASRKINLKSFKIQIKQKNSLKPASGAGLRAISQTRTRSGFEAVFLFNKFMIVFYAFLKRF